MTLGELKASIEQAKQIVEPLAECCAKCQHVGRHANWSHSPSAQCQLNPPGAFVVLETTRRYFKDAMFSKEERVPVSFPPVWPWDKCNQFKLAPESEFLFAREEQPA